MTHPDDIQRIREEADFHQSQATALLLQLGEIAALNVPQFDEEAKSEAELETVAAQKREAKRQQDEADDQAAQSFLMQLPHAPKSVTPVGDGNEAVSYGIESEQIQQALMLDTSLLWIPASFNNNERNIQDWPQQLRWGLRMWLPTYIIGSRFNTSNASASDASEDILLAPAFISREGSAPAVIQARVSVRQRALLHQLSVSKLTTPIRKPEFAARRTDNGFTSNLATSIRKAQYKRHPIDGATLPALPPEKSTSPELQKLAAKLLTEGIDVSFGNSVALTREVIEQYSVATYANQLAQLFGVEPFTDPNITK